MSARSISILLVALVAIVVTAGCGGGDDDGGANSVDLTIAASSIHKAAFVAKMKDVCTRAEAEIFGQSKEQQQSQKEFERGVIQNLSPSLEGIADGIRALGAPAGDEAQVEAIAVAFQDAADQVENDSPTSFPEAEASLGKPSNLAAEYGLRYCVFK